MLGEAREGSHCRRIEADIERARIGLKLLHRDRAAENDIGQAAADYCVRFA